MKRNLPFKTLKFVIFCTISWIIRLWNLFIPSTYHKSTTFRAVRFYLLWSIGAPIALIGQQTQPVLDWSTYFGGSTRNGGSNVIEAYQYVVDDDGSIWFGHLVDSPGTGTPTTPNAWQTAFDPTASGSNSYIGKFSPDGQFQYGSYFGSNFDDFNIGMGQDENYIYSLSWIYNRSTSIDIEWDVTPNNFGLADRGAPANDQGFLYLVKLDKQTLTPVLATELPGTEYLFQNTSGVFRSRPVISQPRGILTQDGYAYFAGRANRRPRSGTNESWAYIIRPDNSGVYIDLRKTAQPNSNPDDHAVRVGDYIVAGNGDFILYGGARGDGSNGDLSFLTTDNTVYTNPVGNWDMFLRRYDRNGNLVFSTLLGGTDHELTYDEGNDRSTKVLEMPDGTIVVSGWTASSDFPYTDGTIDGNSTNDFFIAGYSPDGTRLWTKGLICDGLEQNRLSMAVHPDGQQIIVYTYGDGNSPNNYVITPDAAQPNYGGGTSDQYIAFLDPATGNTNYGTWYGGSGPDLSRGGATSAEIETFGTDILFAGLSYGNFPTTPGATNKDYGTFLVLNGDGSLDLAVKTHILTGKMYMDEDVIYVMGENDDSGVVQSNSTINAFQPETNSPGDNSQAVISMIRRCDGQVAYQTFLGGQNVFTGISEYLFRDLSFVGASQPAFVDDKLYVVSEIRTVLPHPTTEGAHRTSPGGEVDLVLFSFDMAKEVTWEENVLIPEMQITCTNGLAEVIDGSRVVVSPDDLPDIIRGSQESYPEQRATYQWQTASSATGPWTDLNGAVQEDYQPQNIGNQDIYLRRLAFNPNSRSCGDTLSISNIHLIQVSNDEAPVAEAGNPARICPGEDWPLGGSPSATGGTAPYTYKWEPSDALTSISDSSIANPIALPVTSTIYTLEVLDANGCRALDQVTVTPWTYTAGEDLSICFGESGVRIGTPRPAGASEATYSWTILSGTPGSLSCTDCPQPIVSPTVNTLYGVEVNFQSDNGTTCVFTDEVLVNIASHPGTDFAGPDMATCINNPISKNGNYDVITLGNPALPTGPGYSYQWSPLNSFIDGTQQNQTTIEFSNEAFIASPIPLTYTLTMRTPEGCVYQDQVKVYTLEADLGDDRCSPKVVGNYYDPDIYDGNAVYTYNIIGGGGSLDIDNDCEGDDVGGSISGPDLTWVRVLDDPEAIAGDFTDVEQVVNYDGFICRDTVRIFHCVEGDCVFDIEAEGGNCPVVGPNGELTLVPVNEAGGPWPDDGTWTFEWKDASDNILSTDYELTVTDPDLAWYYLQITSTVPIGGDNPCYPDREPHFTMCVDSILVNQLGFSRPMIDFPDTTICYGDEVEIGLPGGGFTYEWTDSTGNFESAEPNPSVSPTVDATYYVKVTEPTTECFSFDTVRVKVLTVPIDAGPDRFICNNAVIQLGEDEGVPGLIYQWQPENAPWRMAPPNTITEDPDGDTKARPWVLVAADLEFVLTVTDPVTGCSVEDTINIYTASSPVVEMASEEIICAGENIVLGPAEENSDYIYEWTPATGLSCTDCFSPVASPATTTEYQLRVRFVDPSCPNDTTLNVAVTVNESDITMGPDMNFCPGDASLQIQGAPSMTDQGNAITSYQWAPNTNMNDPALQSPSVSPPPNSEITYTVTITDANGCQAMGSVTYTPETIANAGSGRTLCIGETVPVGSADNVGTTMWSGARTDALSSTNVAQPIFDSEVSGVGTFQYQVSVTNNGCTSVDMVTVTVQGFDPPVMDPITLCRNSCGVIGFENTDPDLEFFWSPTTGLSDPTSSRTMVCVDSVDRFYELTIRNSVTGCVSLATVSVTVQPTDAPQINIPDISACFGQQLVLEPEVIPETENLTYDWSPKVGLSDPFVRNPALNTEALGLGIHTYELTVIDEHGCINIASMDVIITENGCCTPPVINTIVKDATCGETDGSATIVLPMDPAAYSIVWSSVSGTISPDDTELGNVAPGIYQVTVVDTAVADIVSCAAEEILIVGTHQEDLVVSEVVNEPANCSEGSGGMVQLSPSNYIYNWSDGGTGHIRNDLDAGCYIVEVTIPGSECSDIMEVCVEEAGQLQFTGILEEPACETTDGSITIVPSGGSGTYNAQWSDGQIGLVRENLEAGVYSVAVTDATGCIGDTTLILTNEVNASGALTIATIDPECAGEATGSITFGGSCDDCAQPVNISLLDHSGAVVAENSPATGLFPGTYMVLLEDANGCLIEGQSVVLNDPPTMHLDIDKLEAANCNGEFGSIFINVRGGSPEYSYLWGPDGSTSQNLSGVDSGSYTIVVTDANGCQLSSEQRIVAGSDCCPQIGIQSSVVVDAECGATEGTGTAAVVPTGSPAGYTFAWYDSDSLLVSSDSMATGLDPGAYRVVVHADVPACTDSIVYVLTVGTLQGPQIDVESIVDATCLDSDGSVSVSVVEGIGPVTYLWSTGESTAELTNVPAGTYWVMVSDSTGCSETEVVTIGQTAADLALNISGTDADCNLTNGSATVSVTGGTEPYDYRWSNGLLTQNVSNLSPGIYSVTVTDANGCTQTGDVAINQTGGPTLTIEVAADVLCIGDASGVVNLSSSDPNAVLELRDDQGMILGVGNTIGNLWAGTYTVSARGSDGCVTYGTVTITEPSEVLDLEISRIVPATCEDELGRLDIDVMGGSGPYTYSWSNGATTEDLTNVPAGIYYVVVTDANGCTVEEGYEIGQDINCESELAFRKEHVDLTYTGNPNELLLRYYLIAENTDTLPGYYSLYDSIAFADGVTVLGTPSVSYEDSGELQGTINGGYDGINDLLVMSNDTIAPGEIDTFLISFILQMDLNVLTPESADCDPLNNTGQTGLTNVGSLVSPDSTIRDTVCTPIPLPGVVLNKAIILDPQPTGVVNEYTMTYVITVEDTTGYRAYYDLSDTIQYGSGATFVSGTVTYGGTDGLNTAITTPNPTDTAYQITDDEWIDSLATDSFYVAVIFTIDPATLTTESADCDYSNDGGANSGLTNVAVINDAVPLDRDTVCAPIPNPGVLLTKTILSEPQPTGVVNEYTMTYVITVEDTTGYRAFYDLSDTIQYGSGATFVSGTVTYGGTDGLNTAIITPNPTDTAYQITDDEWIDSLATDSFYVAVIFTIDPATLTTESADCDYSNDGGANSGLTNVAVINDAVPLDRDTVCTPIPVPGVEMTKSIVSDPVPTGNVNEFTMTYVITVEDTTGYRAFYDLSDTIQYGSGAIFVSGTVTYGGTDGLNTAIITPNPTDTAYQITDDEWIDSLRTDSFYVDVIFTIDPATLTAESADCDYSNDGGANSGLTNVAVINDAVPLDRDTICTPIPVPGVEMTKSIVSDPVPTGNVNEFTMTYVITVEDTTGYRAFYDLSDTIQYGSGATFESGTVTYGGTDGLNTAIITPNPTDTAYQITDDEWIDSLRTDSFYVDVIFTIDPATLTAESADCDYSNDGGANSGLTNVAVINDAVPLDRDTICTPIPVPGVEMMKSIVSDPVPTGNVNEFTMTYVITVEDTTGYRAFYDLSDTIQYGSGATFVSGTVTYGGTDGLNTAIKTPNPTDTAYQITDDEWVDSLRTDSFYVAVIFTIDPATLTAESADCDYSNDGRSNSGLTNVAVINDAVPLDRDTACAPIPNPGVLLTKNVIQEQTPTGNVNEFSITYAITVQDTTGYRAYYDLSDTLKYGAGANFVSALVTYAGTDGLQTSILNPNPVDTAFQIVQEEYVDSLNVDSFYVEVIFMIDPDVLTEESADCDYTNNEGQSGLTNVATVSGAVPVQRDSTCAQIFLPGAALVKTIESGPSPTGNPLEYVMTYAISVTDTMGIPVFYDLSDTLQYGAGAEVVSIDIAYDGDHGLQTSILSPTPDTTAYQIVFNELVDNFETDIFYIDVVFTVNPETFTPENADCDPTNDAGGFSGLRNVAVIDNAIPIQRDTACAPIPPPCTPVNCRGYVNLSFQDDCEILITPDMVLVENDLAMAYPEQYKVELFYGPGILIQDNILRPEHAGQNITVRITSLLELCGGGTCEATIELEKPNACIIRNTLDTTVYCIDPFLALDPMDPAYPKPEAARLCGTGEVKLQLSPDWVTPIPCDEENDTASIIYREWTATTPGGERCTGVDTIVVFRLPKLTPEAFVSRAEDSFYCDLETIPDERESLKQYTSWKQPVGLHDYERPYTRLQGLTYEIPATIIIAGLTNALAQGQDVLAEYLECVILRKEDGTEVTIGDIVSGDYMDHLLATLSAEQLTYGFLQALIELNEKPLNVILDVTFNFYPYLLIQAGDWVLSEGGHFEQVDEEWFYAGQSGGNNPYWFAGAWPSIYGTGDCNRIYDAGPGAGPGAEHGCIQIQVPYLTSDGPAPDSCIILCLQEGDHCGVTIRRNELTEWARTGDGSSISCPQTRGIDTWITQTCWGSTPNPCINDLDAMDADGNLEDAVVEYAMSDKKVEIHLSQWQTLYDTIGPVFDFCYPGDWDQSEILESIARGLQYDLAREWEEDNPQIYHVNSHDCKAEIYVPDIQVSDHCSDVLQVKAMVDVPGGTKAVLLDRTSVDRQVLANGDTVVIYTYSHTRDPIAVPFNDCDGELIGVRYEAADHCWNQSEWTRYITIVDDVPPTVVTGEVLNVNLDKKTRWVMAETFDEGSWDNCAVDLKLVRRGDWLQTGTIGDLCDDLITENSYDNWVDLLDDLGIDRQQAEAAVNGISVGETEFNSEYTIDDLAKVLNEGEIENYYFQQLVWLWEDSETCGKKVVHGWLYDLAAYIAEHCIDSQGVEHNGGLQVDDLSDIFDYLTGKPGYGREISLLGGGWSQSVPFTCEDACVPGGSPVELVVFDYCCNWSLGWSTVQVEDKSIPVVMKRLPDLELTCEAYNSFYKTIVEEAADLGVNGSQIDTAGVFAVLDQNLGHYISSWTDDQNNAVDRDGILWPDSVLNFDYYNISCSEKSGTELIPVARHDGTIEWVNQVTRTTFLDTTTSIEENGIVGVNCSAEIVQDIWMDLDECGQGTITRRFTIISGCGFHLHDSVAQGRTMEQVINVRSACGLRESMFDLPDNTGTIDDPICLPRELSENYLPDTLGSVELKAHLAESLCNSLAIGYEVRGLDVVGSKGVKKYEITWTIIDWCASSSASQLNQPISHTQVVVAVINPDCEVDTGGGEPLETSMVSGRIMTELGSAVEEVAVKAVPESGSPLYVKTSANGHFQFSVDHGSKVSVIPYKNIGFSDGVSTADLIDIQRHILQKKALESQYVKIAADVNDNGRIDGLDVLDLRQLILNPSGKFANNTSWRFFDFTTDQEVLNIERVEEDHSVNFVGVKVGDVNLSGDPSSSSRSAHGVLHLSMADRMLKGGEVYRIEVRSDNFEDVRGFQFSLQYSDAYVSIQSIESGLLRVSPDNYLRYAPGMLTMSWSEAESVSAGTDAVLFTIVVKAKSGIAMREALSLNDRVTRTEAYSGTGELRDMALHFDGVDSGFALYQNVPNPYNGETVIGFKLPESGKATISIYDVTGRMVTAIKGDFDEGYNEVRVRSADLGITGVLYYQLTSAGYTSAKKMIVIE